MGKEWGVLLTNKESAKRKPDSDSLIFKHHLFRHDAESFYGFSYEIRNITYLENNIPTTMEGVWIPIANLSTLLSHMSTWKNDDNLVLDKTTLSFQQLLHVIQNQLVDKKFIPGRNGEWELEKGMELLTHASLPPVLSEKLDGSNQFETKREQINAHHQFFNQYLQHVVLRDFDKWVHPYYQSLLLQKDKQIQLWIKALQRPMDQYLLSEHLYPFALKSWNGKTEKPFQFQLLVQEGHGQSSPWTLKLYVKEWATGNYHSIEGIYNGKHPFLTNPMPFIKDQWKRLKNVYPIAMMKLENGECKLSLEEITHFLFHQTSEIEKQGVTVLIPDQLGERFAKPKIMGTIHPVEQVSDSNYRSTRISWTFLINGMTVDDIQFKEWVEGRQEMVYIHNHWVRWDLALAEKLYKEYQNSSRESAFYNNWRKAFLAENIPLNDELEIDKYDGTDGEIQWSFSHSWEQIKYKETTPFTNKWESLLRSYQRDGVQWLLKMREYGLGACLADDMGLGKTIQTIAYMDMTKTVYQEKPFLIICPTSLVTNWVQELEKFASNLSIYVHEGKPVERRARWKEAYLRSDIILCSYPLAVRDMGIIQGFQYLCLVLDEAQRVKNVQTKIRNAIRKITSTHIIALSGTPVENDPMELWSIIDLLNPGYLKDQDWFQSKFLQRDNDEGEKLKQLKALVNPFLLRRKKEQFAEELELPEKRLYQHTVPLTDEQKVLYEAVVNDLLEEYLELSVVEKRSRVFKAITKLKQICNHPAHYLKEPSIHHMTGRSGKWDLCIDLLEKNWRAGKRTLIFTQYRYLGNLLQQFIHQHWNVNVPFFHGQLSVSKRKELVDKFQKEQTDPFLLISLRAGGVGLNLTAATEVIHFDRWWNPAVENQATDRVYRIGQKRAVTVHTFLTEGTIEEKLNQLIGEKLSLQDALLNGAASPIWKLSDEEMLALFQLRR